MSATCPVHKREYTSMGFGVLACPEKNCPRGTTVTALEQQQDKANREAQPIRQKEPCPFCEEFGISPTCTEKPFSMTIELPMPPSVNHIYFTAPNGQRLHNADYKAWKDEAGWKLQGYGLAPYTRPVRLRMVIHGGIGFTRACDLSNRWKTLEDLLVAHGILRDDNVQYVIGHSDDYVAPTTKGQQSRCLLTIEEAEG